MDIGGIDAILESNWPPNVAALVVMGYFYDTYPKGCHENDNQDGRREFFFYTSPEAKQAWDEHGHTDEFGPEMFYVICDSGCPPYQVTIVHDREGYDFSRIASVLKMSAAEIITTTNSALQPQKDQL